MKRNYKFDITKALNNQEITKQIAFHEAGHAAAIYLCNKEKKLPPVHFQITINNTDDNQSNFFETREMSNDHAVAAVEGGRLIHQLPITLIESANYFSTEEADSYQTAFEADMINLLVGPLAEAKYVALRDNESFGPKLFTTESLHFYGGTSDLARVQDYLDSYISTKDRHEEKINYLLAKAFAFIDTPKYWRAIERLAVFIMDSNKSVISCEEAINALEQSITKIPIVRAVKAEPIETYVLQLMQ